MFMMCTLPDSLKKGKFSGEAVPKRKRTAVFSRYLADFHRFLRKTAVMYQFSAVYQIAVVITDFRTVTLAVISNTSYM